MENKSREILEEYYIIKNSYPIDTRLYYDGLPVDENHIATNKNTRERFNKLIKEESKPKQFIKKLFKRK